MTLFTPLVTFCGRAVVGVWGGGSDLGTQRADGASLPKLMDSRVFFFFFGGETGPSVFLLGHAMTAH